jgi:hypothetical protein
LQLSIIGVVVCLAILALGHYCRGTLIVGLLASLAFGSTAVMTLSSLGGSSPLIYTVFAGLFVATLPARHGIWQDLGRVFGSIRSAWVLTFLMAYAVVGAWLFPRLFAGEIAVFVQSKLQRGAVVESVLAPVSGNTSQTGYFVLGGLTAIALCALLLRGHSLVQIRRGFFAWCILHTGMGLLDLMGKLVGAGDVLRPIRTASYAMLTQTMQSGFWRIAGSYSEASAFGAASLACLAFTYTYWRRTGSGLAKYLTATLLGLAILSTSSTAYVGLAVISMPVVLSMGLSFASKRLASNDALILAIASAGVLATLAITVQNEKFFDPVVRLFDSMIVDKVNSGSGQERAYWNTKSLQAFADTGGAGVGMGSSRASSWPIAVLSQLGLIGSLLMAALVAVVARGIGRHARWLDSETNAVVSSVRSSALASIVAASIVGGTADPGMIFFIAVAVVSACRFKARRLGTEQPLTPGWQSGTVATWARPPRAVITE